jgi:hypothetical protein
MLYPADHFFVSWLSFSWSTSYIIINKFEYRYINNLGLDNAKMSKPVRFSPLAALPPHHRRNTLAILLVSLVLARSGPVVNLDGVVDTISLKTWREARKHRKEERRRRQMETPLSVSFVFLNGHY